MRISDWSSDVCSSDLGPARLGEVGGFPAIGGARDTNTASQQKEGFMTAPIPAQKAPFKVSVEAGKKYFWCACGRSKKQPFCDGSHSGTGLSPVAYEASATKDVFFCGCKATGRQPLCDGRHAQLAPPPAAHGQAP